MEEGDAKEYWTIYNTYIIHQLVYLMLRDGLSLQDVIIAKARINNVYQSSDKFVQHLIWENSVTSSFSLVMLSEYFKIDQNNWESIR